MKIKKCYDKNEKNYLLTFIKYKKLKNKINKNIKYEKNNIIQIFFHIAIK